MAGRREVHSIIRRLQRCLGSSPLSFIETIPPLSAFTETPHTRNTITPRRWMQHDASSSTFGASSHFSEADGDDGPTAPAEDLQQQVLSAALEHVHTLGWSTAAMQRAAEELGLSPAIVGSFPRREGNLIEAFNSESNKKLERLLVEHAGELEGMRIRERITYGIKSRLEMNIPLLDFWADALSVQSRPAEVPHSLKNYARIADIIWRRAAGDTSVDFNWYTKRGVLMGVYVATELCMLTDSSQDKIDTWEFLDRRIEDVMVLGKQTGSVTSLISSISDVMGGVLGGAGHHHTTSSSASSSSTSATPPPPPPHEKS